MTEYPTRLSFTLRAADGRARVGEFMVNGRVVETPVFMPVGTAGSVKALPPEDLAALGAQICLGNTYHLYLRPGVEIVRQAGGLHRFINWEAAILTDSGGYQVFSLQELRKIEPDGVRFRSHLDGSEHFFSPEGVFDIQAGLGSDIAMVLDVCTPYPATHEQATKELEVTLNWALQSKARSDSLADSYRSNRSNWSDTSLPALFGIVQGSVYADLRAASAQRLVEIGFDGYAIGGLSVGEPKSAMWEMTEATVPHLPADRPRYLMGVGTPEDLIMGIDRGIDMFDCVLPTRAARHGTAFTPDGPLTVKAGRYSDDFTPLDAECTCPTCRGYTRAYVRHLFNAGEISAMILTTRHNLHFYLSVMRRARRAIRGSEWTSFRDGFLARYRSDAHNRS